MNLSWPTRAAAALAIGLLGVGAANAAPSYMPVGPQLNVAVATVTSGGWTPCYTADFATPFGTHAATTLAACSGDLLMLAGHQKGASTYALLAAAPTASALLDTGAGTSDTHIVNGSAWYNSDRWAFGFTTAGNTVTLNSCDTESGADRLCLHTTASTGGFRVGSATRLNASTTWEKVVLTASSAAVPEPLSLALLGSAVAFLGMVRRRSG